MDDSPKISRGVTGPGIVAAAGALFAVGLGFGMPGAVVGGVLGLIVGVLSEKDRQEREKR